MRPAGTRRARPATPRTALLARRHRARSWASSMRRGLPRGCARGAPGRCRATLCEAARYLRGPARLAPHCASLFPLAMPVLIARGGRLAFVSAIGNFETCLRSSHPRPATSMLTTLIYQRLKRSSAPQGSGRGRGDPRCPDFLIAVAGLALSLRLVAAHMNSTRMEAREPMPGRSRLRRAAPVPLEGRVWMGRCSSSSLVPLPRAGRCVGASVDAVGGGCGLSAETITLDQYRLGGVLGAR